MVSSWAPHLAGTTLGICRLHGLPGPWRFDAWFTGTASSGPPLASQGSTSSIERVHLQQTRSPVGICQCSICKMCFIVTWAWV